MRPIDVFLRDHGQVHASAVADNSFTIIDELLGGVSESEMRTSVAGMNPAAWILWHMARVEDGCLATCVFNRPQVLDQDGWGPRLGVAARGNGFGMSQAEVADVAASVDLAALRAYRDAVGRRTRALASALWPDAWWEPVTEDDVRRVAAAGLGQPDAGEPREGLLLWWGIYHNFWHIGQWAAISGRLRADRSAPQP